MGIDGLRRDSFGALSLDNDRGKDESQALKEEQEAKEIDQLVEKYRLRAEEVSLMMELFKEADSASKGVLDVPMAEILLRKALTTLYPMGEDNKVILPNEKITLPALLEWLSVHSMEKDAFVSPQQRKIKEVSRRWGVPCSEVEDLHDKFARFDLSGNGRINAEEFRQLLHFSLKPPSGVEFPTSRLSFFWKEVDRNRSGSICFEEFFNWYRKYFSIGSGEDFLDHYAQS